MVCDRKTNAIYGQQQEFLHGMGGQALAGTAQGDFCGKY